MYSLCSPFFFFSTFLLALLSILNLVFLLSISLSPYPAKLSEGDKLFGYTVEKVTAVPDFDLAAVTLSHDGTGAQHVHLARRDSNNVFRCSHALIQCCCFFIHVHVSVDAAPAITFCMCDSIDMHTVACGRRIFAVIH